jgi:hypothetical protein
VDQSTRGNIPPITSDTYNMMTLSLTSIKHVIPVGSCTMCNIDITNKPHAVLRLRLITRSAIVNGHVGKHDIQFIVDDLMGIYDHIYDRLGYTYGTIALKNELMVSSNTSIALRYT